MIRVNDKLLCKICGSNRWCSYTEDGLYCACKRISKNSLTVLGSFGYLHKLETKIDLTGYEQKEKQYVDFKALHTSYKVKLSTTGEYPTIDGIQYTTTYDAYFCGYSGWAWTFPVFDDKLSICGIQCRWADGKKCSVTGTRVGLFIPSTIKNNDVIGITEGLSDAMAAYELGIPTIGLWNCEATNELAMSVVLEYFKPKKGVVIFADNDEPGKKCATNLKMLFKTYSPNLPTKVITPVVAKDLREWVLSGFCRADLNKLLYRGNKCKS